MKDKQFFIDNIGHRIYRDYRKCCKTCDKVYENGLVVNDEEHADYLYNLQNEFANEGYELNYRLEK